MMQDCESMQGNAMMKKVSVSPFLSCIDTDVHSSYSLLSMMDLYDLAHLHGTSMKWKRTIEIPTNHIKQAFKYRLKIGAAGGQKKKNLSTVFMNNSWLKHYVTSLSLSLPSISSITGHATTTNATMVHDNSSLWHQIESFKRMKNM